jgi:hypothetical protein
MTTKHNSAIWPADNISIAQDVRDLIIRFFDISDSTDPSSGQQFAYELFAEDGFFKTHETCIFKGREGM